VEVFHFLVSLFFWNTIQQDILQPTDKMDDDLQKKRAAPWSPDATSRPPHKKTTNGRVVSERRDSSLLIETPFGIPQASPASLKQRAMVKVIRKKGVGEECAGVKYSIIKTRNGSSIPFIRKAIKTVSFSVDQEDNSISEIQYLSTNPTRSETMHSRLQLLQGILLNTEKEEGVPLLENGGRQEKQQSFNVYLARQTNPNERKAGDPVWIDRSCGLLTISPETGHLKVMVPETKKYILNATVPFSRNPWGVSIIPPSASSSLDYTLITMLQDTSGLSIGRRAFALMFPNHQQCMSFLDIYMKGSACSSADKATQEDTAIASTSTSSSTPHEDNGDDDNFVNTIVEEDDFYPRPY
jgi:hypothetical protein